MIYLQFYFINGTVHKITRRNRDYEPLITLSYNLDSYSNFGPEFWQDIKSPFILSEVEFMRY